MTKHATGQKIIVRQTRSAIGHPKRQHGTLRGLGLGRIGHTMEHTLTPSVAGMLKAVSHLIQVEQVSK